MHILMLSWEYPPKVTGGLARHVAELSRALAARGHRVSVITADDPESPARERENGLEVHRLRMHNPIPGDFVGSVMQLNMNMIEAGIGLIKNDEIDIIHAHDWLAAYSAKALKHAFRKPLVATIHATEWGRNNGLNNDLQRYISDVEWWLTYEAWRVICCSEYMRDEVKNVFQTPDDKLVVIPNGVYPEQFNAEVDDLTEFRGRYAAPGEKMVFFIGRLVREKGVETLLYAIPSVLARYPQAKFVIAGKGPAFDHLHKLARELGIYDRVYFTGFIDDETRNRLYRCADVAVFPSLYEPFGIVALEGMAANCPVVASDTGGMAEIVEHGINGLKAYPGNPDSLADNITALLMAPGFASKLRNRAYRDVKTKYNWDTIAKQTASVYEMVMNEYRSSSWCSKTSVREEEAFPAGLARFFSTTAVSRYASTGSSNHK